MSLHIDPIANTPFLAHFFFMNTALATEISRLTPAEKLEVVMELWDDLASREGGLPIPAWHERILTEDQAFYRVSPGEGSSWPEAKARILGQS
jgi:hypothetical protein